MKNVASVKDRLKNRSRETGKTLQELFTVYGMGHHSAVLMPHGVSLAIFLLIPGAKLLKVSIEKIY